jgi:hypothetical protein
MTRHPKLGAVERRTALWVNFLTLRQLEKLRRSGALQGALGADGLGSVTSLSNSAGALGQTYSFDSFGKQTASAGSLVNPFQYTGRELDSETGLYYYRARYYDRKRPGIASLHGPSTSIEGASLRVTN